MDKSGVSATNSSPKKQESRRNARRSTRASSAQAHLPGLPQSPPLKEQQATDSLRLTPSKRKQEQALPRSKRRKEKHPSDASSQRSEAVNSSEKNDMDEAEEQRARESLQHLLSQLGSFGNAFNANRSKYTKILSDLQQMGDEATQIGGLVELCDLLAMATEDSMGGFKVNEFVSALEGLLQFEHNPEVMLLATRALAYMVEALPSSGTAIVESNAVPIFCSRMLSIQYIDVAEQSLQALYRLSVEHPDALLRHGALLAVLAFLDFFSTASQRTCVSTAANICRGTSTKSFDMIRVALPNLTGTLLNHDKQVVHSAMLCFARLTARSMGNPEELREIGSPEAVTNLLALINGTTPLGTSVPKSTAFSILARFAKHSTAVVTTLLGSKILATIATIIDPRTVDATGAGVGSPMRSSLGTSPMLAYDSAASDDLLAALNVAEALLPSLPLEDAMPTEFKGKFTVPKGSSGKAKKAEKPSELFEVFSSHPEHIQDIGDQLYNSVQTVFSATVSKKVKSACLGILVKVIYFSTPEQLKSLLRDMGTSSFIAFLLARPHLVHVAAALYMADLLMSKLPEIFVIYFYREGVFQGIEKLCEKPVKATSPSGSSNAAGMKKWIYKKALEFTKKNSSSKADAAANNALDRMKKAVKALTTSSSVLEERQHLESVRTILVDGLSNYEFIQSGLVSALAQYLKHGDDFTVRSELFMDVMEEEGVTLWQELLTHLQSSLAQLENYPLYDNNVNGSNSGLKYLTQPLKLKIVPMDGVSDDYAEAVAKGGIMIEAMASIGAIEDYILSAKKEAGDRGGGLFDSLRALKRRAKRQQRRRRRAVGVHDLVDEDSESPGPSSVESAHADDSSSQEESETAEEESDDDGDEDEITERTAGTHEFALFYKGERLSYEKSILQEAYSYRTEDEDQPTSVYSPAKAVWADVHTISFRHLTEQEKKETTGTQGCSSTVSDNVASPKAVSAGTCDTTSQILDILKTLNSLLVGKGVEELLTNSKLAAKLQRQLQDGLTLCAGALPDWCLQLGTIYPFLFPYEYRLQLFKASNLGVARALHALQEHSESGTAMDGDGNQFRVGRIQRQKVRVKRETILECAQKALELYGRSKTMLEVEFQGEEGTGTGPSLEFFTLVSHQLQRHDLGLWYEEDTAELRSSGQPLKVAYSGHGLFPNPLPEGQELDDVLPWYLMLGRFLGKAVLDSRLVDITFAPPFLGWMLGKALVEADMAVISPTVWKSFVSLRTFAAERSALLSDGFLNEEERALRLSNLRYCEGTIEDLGLDFTFPGQPDWELKEGGKGFDVTASNLEEYLDLVVNTFLSTGVEKQLLEFKKGFEEVLPLSSLRLFDEEEVQNLLSGFEEGREEVWSRDAFLAAISCDHHYSVSSAPVGYLADVVASLDRDQRRAFVQFVTGTPRLPVGGFRSLSPPITVVRKETGGSDPDQFLPSVMTCAKVLKLPAYTSVDAARLRVLFAINEGQDSFALS